MPDPSHLQLPTADAPDCSGGFALSTSQLAALFSVIQVVGYATSRAGWGLTAPDAILNRPRKREHAMGATMPFSKFDVDF
jgi:hypothetical protein